jgi:hypothetical protein
MPRAALGWRRTGEANVDETATTTDAPAGPTDVRRAAIVLGASAAALELVAGVLLTVPGGLSVGPALLGLLWLAVPVAGVVLLRRGDERGVALLIATGALSFPQVIGGGYAIGGWPWAIHLMLLANAALVAAGVLAWRSRDRPQWDRIERARDPVLLVAAGGVVLATILPTTAFAVRPIGADPWWHPLLSRASGIWAIAAFVLAPFVLAGLLWLASRSARPLAGAVVGAVAVIGLAGALFNLVQATVSAEFRLTPVGWLDLVAHAALLVIAVRWWTADEVAADGS